MLNYFTRARVPGLNDQDPRGRNFSTSGRQLCTPSQATRPFISGGTLNGGGDPLLSRERVPGGENMVWAGICATIH